jgi:phosphoribosylaminoimidazole (AIR) synthetase/phosphoribosylamine-glycine ligase/folate-dependent phosphoribosylglycinamide formyltransferase PurN
MDKKILILGSGPREYALAQRLLIDEDELRIYVAPGNAHTREMSPRVQNVENVEEIPGVSWNVHTLQENPVHLPVIIQKPSNTLLESSRLFAKRFCEAENIPTTPWAFSELAFASPVEAWELASSCSFFPSKMMISVDSNGLRCTENFEEFLSQHWREKLIFEECPPNGLEFTALAFCDGNTCLPMPLVYKHSSEAACAPCCDIPETIRTEANDVIQRTVQAMARRGMPYQGVLGGCFIYSQSSGITLLEYRCEFGDPECQTILPLLETSLWSIFLKMKTGFRGFQIQWKNNVYSASMTLTNRKSQKVTGVDKLAKRKKVQVCYGDLKQFRALSVVSTDRYLRGAVRNVYNALFKTVRIGSVAPYYPTTLGRNFMPRQLKVALLVLGQAKTLLDMLLFAKEKGLFPGIDFRLIIVHHLKSPVISKAKKYHVPVFVVDNNSEQSIDEILLVHGGEVDLLLLMGIPRPGLSASFLTRHNCIRVHPSFLPEFSQVDEDSIHATILKEKRPRTGCTVHWVPPQGVYNHQGVPPMAEDRILPVPPGGCTALGAVPPGNVCGAPLYQKIVPVRPGDTVCTLRYRVQEYELVCLEKAFHRLLTYGKEFFTTPVSVENLLSQCAPPPPHPWSRRELIVSHYVVDTKLEVGRQHGLLEGIGMDLVALATNDILEQGGIPQSFYFYRQIPDTIARSVARGCSRCNIPYHLLDSSYEIESAAGFAVGQRTTNSASVINDGDILLGIESSGCHESGMFVVRQIMERSNLSWTTPTPWIFNTARPRDEVTFVEWVLRPTVAYFSVLDTLLRTNRIKAIAHVDKGGLIESLYRVIASDIDICLNSRQIEDLCPPIFRWLQYVGQLSSGEMYRSFNMGIGMILVVDPADESDISYYIRKRHLNVVNIGTLRK